MQKILQDLQKKKALRIARHGQVKGKRDIGSPEIHPSRKKKNKWKKQSYISLHDGDFLDI